MEHIDQRNSQQIWGIEGWGKEGITERLSVLFPAKIAGRSGYHTLTLIYTNKTGVDLRDIPELLLPPGSGAALGIKSGSCFVSYGIQQYLWQDPKKPGRGFGFFGQAGVSDRNPNPFGWMMLAGLGGTGVAGRGLDRYGAGYLRYTLSSDLTDALRLLHIDLYPEQGVETFYNAAITPWFHVVGDLQVVAPGSRSSGTSTFAGLSAQIKF